MTKEQIEAILDRVLTWPAEQQEKAANMLLAIESSDSELFQLTPDEIADLEEALAEIERGEVASDEEVAAVFRLRK